MASEKKSALPKTVGVPRPSSSVLLISATNQILLLHRVHSSSSFASAHVFPGGNVDPFHDGALPPPEDAQRHVDGSAYRLAAIRETFEESGILLARNNGFGRLIEVEDNEREAGRKIIHNREMPFEKWLAGKGGRADVDGLIPFTRWVTPTNIPKRFTTQMYIYFLPLSTQSDTGATGITSKSDVVIPAPSHDGGLEHTAARFLPPSEWISLANSGEVLLFPPQFFLLSMIAPFLSPKGAGSTPSKDELILQRQQLNDFLRTSNPPWGEKCISPSQLMRRQRDGRAVLGLEKPGPELKDSQRRGESDRVVLVDFTKGGPRNVQVAWKKEIMEEERQSKGQL